MKTIIVVFVFLLAALGAIACDKCEENCKRAYKDPADEMNDEYADPPGSWDYQDDCVNSTPAADSELDFFCTHYWCYKNCMDDC